MEVDSPRVEAKWPVVVVNGGITTVRVSSRRPLITPSEYDCRYSLNIGRYICDYKQIPRQYQAISPTLSSSSHASSTTPRVASVQCYPTQSPNQIRQAPLLASHPRNGQIPHGRVSIWEVPSQVSPIHAEFSIQRTFGFGSPELPRSDTKHHTADQGHVASIEHYTGVMLPRTNGCHVFAYIHHHIIGAVVDMHSTPCRLV